VGIFRLAMPQGAPADLAISVSDMTGRTVVLHQQIAQGTTATDLDLMHLAAGTYLLHVQSKDQRAQAVLVIQR
jgi:hypothetical protein